MSTLNVIQCQDARKNTGKCDCFFDPKNIVGAIFVPKNKVFTEAELAEGSVAATMAAAILADSALRIYPFAGFVGMADNSEDPVKQSFGFGTSETVREGNYKWTPEFRNGGVNLNNALRSFNGKQNKFAVIFIDANNVLIGTTKLDGTGANGLAGIPQEEIYTFPWKANDGSKTTQYRTGFEFKPLYVNEKIGFVKVEPTELILTELNGLIDVTLTKSAATNTTVTVKVTAACGEDLFDEFADALADTDAFILTNATTGGVILLTSIVKNETLKAWVITIPTSSNANYPSTGSVYNVNLATPDALAVLGVDGYESTGVLAVTRPS